MGAVAFAILFLGIALMDAAHVLKEGTRYPGADWVAKAGWICVFGTIFCVMVRL